MSNRRRNSRRNKHVITYYWRGDIEDMQSWRFPTKEEAWAHVVGKVRKRVKHFEAEEASGYSKTIVDWEKLFSDLFNKGDAEVEYCQCSAWWDNWGYYKKD